MPSEIDKTSPEVYDRDKKQYDKGVTKESMVPGNPQEKDKNKK